MGEEPRTLKEEQVRVPEQVAEVVAAEPRVVMPEVWVKYARPETEREDVVAMA
jgi:hypothetical protein